MLTLLLFGQPQVRREGRDLEVPRRKSRALLFYLAARASPVARDQLLAMFWPDLERSAAQQNLRTTLHGLRRLLGPAIVARDTALALASDVDVDARTIERVLADPLAGVAERAAALDRYRGDFLEGFSLGEDEPFDDWVIGERERYRQLMIRGLTALAAMYEAEGDYAAGLDALDRALGFDPLQEDLQRSAMRLHYLDGDRVGAIRRYEQLRRLLDDEMGVPPMTSTRELYDAVVTDTLVDDRRRATDGARPAQPQDGRWATAVGRSTGALPFTGRAAELGALRAATAASRLALLEGEPGIGKTRLAEEFIAAQGGLALVGAARELERSLPYQPVIDTLRGLASLPDWPTLRGGLEIAPVWLAEAARLVPELAGPSGARLDGRPADESRLWEAVTRLLLAVARRRPLVLFVDDLHWADTATLALLGYLARRASEAPIALVAAARPADSRSPLATLVQSLTREGRLARVPLSRLSPDETLALARRLSPAASEPLAAWLMHNAEGNPYILAELVRYARENRMLGEDGVFRGAAHDGSPVVPQNVYSLIQQRLARLSEPARRVLDAGVAVGREFEFDVVARAAALSEQAALDAIDELRGAGLVSPTDGTRYTFDHSLTMEVAYREVGEPRHRLLHRRVAEALEGLHRGRADEVAGLIASHFIEGNAPDRAAPYAFRAGQLASRLAAWHEAVGFYEQALAGGGEDRRAEVLMALGDAHFQAGELPQAAEVFREAMALAEGRDAERAADARLSLAETLISQTRFAELIALVEPLRTSGSPRSRFRAEFLRGTALSLEGADLEGAMAHLRAAEALSAEYGDQTGQARVLFEEGSIAAQQGDLDTAIDRYRGAMAIVDEATGDEATVWRILSRNNLAYHLHLLGSAEAADYAREGLRLAQESGTMNLQPYLLSTLGEIALVSGDLAAAERSFNEGLALAERLEMQERVAGLTANLGLVAKRGGLERLAIHRLSGALARADALGTQHLAAQIRIWLAPLLPEAEARAMLAEARAIAERGGRRRLLAEVERIEADLSAPRSSPRSS